MTNAQVTAKLTELKNTFCQNLYWNHDPSQTNDPSSVRSIPCNHTHPDGCSTSGSCGCNSYANSIQCHGFAQYMAYRVFGSSPAVSTNPSSSNGGSLGNGWKLYTGDYCRNLTLEPGDIIRDPSHTAIVWKNESGVISVGEVWGSYGCKINWGSFNSSYATNVTSQQTLLSIATYIVKAPKDTGVTIKFIRNFNDEDNTVIEERIGIPGTPHGTMPTATRSHYRFDGWFANRDGTGQHTASTTVHNYDYNLYAHWTYEIVVNFKRNHSSDDDTNFHVGTYYSSSDKYNQYGSIPSPTRSGFAFLGWSPNRDDKENLYSMDRTVRYDHNLYAQWQWLAPVKFMNNYTSEDDSVYYSDEFVPGQPYGSKMPDKSTVSRTHFRCNGWFANRSGGNEYTQTTLVPSYEHSLYAQWTWLAPVKFYRNYNADDDTIAYEGDFEPGQPYGNNMPDDSTMVRNGYFFNGWFADRSGGNEYTRTTSVPSYAHSLYAQWSQRISISFNSNYTGGTTNVVELPEGKAFGDILEEMIPTRANCSFAGWYTSQTGGTRVVTSTLVPGSNTTLYAHWKVSIYFETYGGELEGSNTVLYSADSPYGYLPDCCCRGASWSFAGWYTGPNGTGDLVTTESITPSQHSTIYAKWNTD